MANENLRQALTDAGLAPDELAELVRVEDRTMRRWLAGTVPYARHRAQLARALDRPEHELWPELADSTTAAEAAGPAAVPDTIHAYADPWAPGVPSLEALLAGASEQIDLLGYSSRGLLDHPGITDLLLAKAAARCRVRIMLTQPDRDILASLLAVPGIQVRRGDVDAAPDCERIDDQILAWLSFTDARMLLHASRDSAPGLFSQLTERFQRAWEHATPVQTTDDIDEAFNDTHHAPPPADSQPVAGPAKPDVDPPRRWPGRPS
ncbi:MAG: hypothetical protein ACRDNS_14670 [Trebonia sp.]